MKRKAIIFGIKGTKLTTKERYILKYGKPWGIILFKRNIKNIYQLKLLVQNIKKIFNDNKYPILIDQEGGSVSRINNIINLSLFSQNYFGKLYKKDKNLFLYQYKLYINKVSSILKMAGININTVPVLDVLRNKSSKIICGRSFSKNPNIVSKLGKLCIELYSQNNIATVVKHIPGHGLAKTDSHFFMPKINAEKKELKKIDFKPFKNCKSLFAMTAHVLYKKYDSNFTTTHSKILINEVIRKDIGFKGILISDDISMKALKYGLQENTTKALEAGCNLILHCNSNIKEMRKLIKIVPTIDKFTKKKTSHFYKFLG